MSRLALPLAAAAALAVATAAFAESHTETPPQVEARHGLMTTMALSTKVTGDMARGEAEYDADAAQVAADTIAAVSDVPTALIWTEGTSAEEVEESRALPVIWEDRADFESKWDNLGTAAEALQQAAGQGQEQLTAAMGDLGKACGACHETYREKE